jgi:hypothetical protein
LRGWNSFFGVLSAEGRDKGRACVNVLKKRAKAGEREREKKKRGGGGACDFAESAMDGGENGKFRCGSNPTEVKRELNVQMR